MSLVIEIRCPVGPRRLLAKMQATGEQPHVVSGNLLEIACTDCARYRRRENGNVFRILHRYNLIGELVETVEELRVEERTRDGHHVRSQ